MVLGTNIIPINPTVSILDKQSNGNARRMYALNFDNLSTSQRGNLIKHMADKNGYTKADVERWFQSGKSILIPVSDCMMDEFTHEQVGIVRDLYRDEQTKHDPLGEAYNVAWEIMLSMLGPTWIKENIHAQFDHAESRVRFLRIKREDELDAYRRQERLHGLAEILFVLQWCRGFTDPCIKN